MKHAIAHTAQWNQTPANAGKGLPQKERNSPTRDEQIRDRLARDYSFLKQFIPGSNNRW